MEAQTITVRSVITTSNPPGPWPNPLDGIHPGTGTTRPTVAQSGVVADDVRLLKWSCRKNDVMVRRSNSGTLMHTVTKRKASHCVCYISLFHLEQRPCPGMSCKKTLQHKSLSVLQLCWARLTFRSIIGLQPVSQRCDSPANTFQLPQPLLRGREVPRG